MSLKKRTKIEPRQNQTRQAPLGALPLGPAFSPDPGFTSEPRLLPDSGSMPIHPNKLPSHQPHLLPSSTKPHPSAFFVVLARGIASWLDFDGQLVGMFSFLTKCRQPPRTKAAHLNTLVFDEGRSTAEFKAPGDRFLVINRLPPATQTSSLAPPLHRHWYQEETFHVISGTAKFTLSRQTTTRIAKVGETVVIPKGEAHTFANASNTEELVIEFALDPPRVGRDETYFRNVWGYRNDCKRCGESPSLLQALSFMYSGGVVKVLPGPEIFSRWLGYALNYVGGFLIARLLFGYRGSYPEYFHERSL